MTEETAAAELAAGFNAREGLVTFPTEGQYCFESRVVYVEFQCPRGLGDFSHPRGKSLKSMSVLIVVFQCPRGLGDFSHYPKDPDEVIEFVIGVSMPARTW